MAAGDDALARLGAGPGAAAYFGYYEYAVRAYSGPSSPTAARLRAIAGTPPVRTPPSIGSRSSIRPDMSTRDKITALLAVRPTVKAAASTPGPAPTLTRPRATVEPATRPAVDALEGDNRDDIVDEDIYRASNINANDGGSNDDGGRDADGNENNNVEGGEDNNN
ncbi:hypothetical protein SPI_02883 [Niveomyces insectorum RCEF 264]|uniref:Uncharacterized protein n=1 Tax=Niveomyces insectorum RCEF 264 TaxID=1081102 RepID=A0A167WVN9_9HYPO|nr:hypothetical protein SPI_02883 [Niveomyces insectorum RCEF 264]